MGKKYPPISPNTPVKTIKPNYALRDEWTNYGWVKRKWGVYGRVITHHDSHGLCYDVQHEDGTMGCYDPSEIEVIDAIDLNELQEETKKLLALLKDRQPGLITWNEFLCERLRKIQFLLSIVVK